MPHVEESKGAQMLYQQSWLLDRDYLEHRIGKHDLLAIAAAGYQKETWAIELLKVRAAAV